MGLPVKKYSLRDKHTGAQPEVAASLDAKAVKAAKLNSRPVPNRKSRRKVSKKKVAGGRTAPVKNKIVTPEK